MKKGFGFNTDFNGLGYCRSTDNRLCIVITYLSKERSDIRGTLLSTKKISVNLNTVTL